MTILLILLIIVLIVESICIIVIDFKQIKNYELIEELENAELRAVTHFRKLIKIEDILRKAEEEKTPAVIVLDKINEVIVGKNK